MLALHLRPNVLRKRSRQKGLSLGHKAVLPCNSGKQWRSNMFCASCPDQTALAQALESRRNLWTGLCWYRYRYTYTLTT